MKEAALNYKNYSKPAQKQQTNQEFEDSLNCRTLNQAIGTKKQFQEDQMAADYLNQGKATEYNKGFYDPQASVRSSSSKGYL